MKFLHVSDLHLGRHLGAFSRIEEQRAMLDWVYDTLCATEADVLLIAGDVYDRAVPGPDAVVALDHFLSRVHDRAIPICVTGGNHDSVERLSFASDLLSGADVYVSPPLAEGICHVTFTDSYGAITVWLLPFCRPADVRDAGIAEAYTYSDAMAAVVGSLPIDRSGRNIALAHQFLTGSMRAESESVQIGGLDNVDAAIFAPFDYTALGHLHRHQSLMDGRIVYSGSPLCYDFGEAEDEKGAVLVEIGEKGTLSTTFLAYREPLRRLVTLRGSYSALAAKSYWEGLRRDDYFRVLLTDTEDVPDAAAKLSVLYPRLIFLTYENRAAAHGGSGGEMGPETPCDRGSAPEEVFAAFFAMQNDRALTAEERSYITALLAQKEDTDEAL